MPPISTPDEMKQHLRGALAFPITPYDANGDVDLDAVRANADFLATSRVASIVAPSGTGEFFSLSSDEVNAVLQATVEAAAGRKPVIAAAGMGPRVAAEQAAFAESAGASAIMVVPPYYGKPDPGALIDYYAAIADATSLAIIPYARDAAEFTPAMVQELAERIPSAIAFKDGRGNVRLFQQIREHVIGALGEDRMVWLGGTGDDLLGPYVAAGAEGYTSSVACFWPEKSAELYDLASSGDFASLREQHDAFVGPLYELRQRKRGYEVGMMKAAMELLGHRAGPARPPLANPTEAERDELKALLDRFDIPTADTRRAVTAG
jgi:5-dehydro-4-deoxyglucarate dehydratase